MSLNNAQDVTLAPWRKAVSESDYIIGRTQGEFRHILRLIQESAPQVATLARESLGSILREMRLSKAELEHDLDLLELEAHPQLHGFNEIYREAGRRLCILYRRRADWVTLSRELWYAEIGASSHKRQ